MYVESTGAGVSAGAEAEPHEAERAIPAAAAMIEMILTSFIYLIIFKFDSRKKRSFQMCA